MSFSRLLARLRTPSTVPAIGLAIVLVFAWANFLTTTRWADVDGALNGPKQPYYAVALAAATALAIWHRRRIGQPVRVNGLGPALLLAAGVATIAGAWLSRLPPSAWTQFVFEDDWVPLFRAAADGVHLMQRGVVMGWNWSFLGGYPASVDVAQSFALHALLPMTVFGDTVGFHVLQFIWLFAVPAFVWWDLRHEDRATARLAAAFACFFAAGYTMFLGRSGDVNSLAGVFSAGLALVGSRAIRLNRRWGGPVMALGLTLALYSHIAFFVYAGIYLTVETIYYRDWRALIRIAGAAVVAAVAALPVYFESLLYPAFVSFNNVVYTPGAPVDWAQTLRVLYYNVEILLLPQRWFNDYRSLANVWLPAIAVAALLPGRTRVGFYAWATLVTQGLLRLNTGEFGAGFDRIMHMLPLLAAPAIAGFILRAAGSQPLAAALAIVVSLYPAVTFAPLPHVQSVREFNPALVDRLATLDGNLVALEIAPHRDMDSDPVGRTVKAPWSVHYEGLLPQATGRRFFGQMFDGWMFSTWRGEVIGGGAYMGQAIGRTPPATFADDLRRWGVRHVVVWTDASRHYLESSPAFVERWREHPWAAFELPDSDGRSIVTSSGRGRLTDLDPLGAHVRLDGVEEGSRVVVRTHYYPAWSARSGDVDVPLYEDAGQLAFDAPANGSYDVILEYPRRYWLQALALVALVAGAWGLSRRPFFVRRAHT